MGLAFAVFVKTHQAQRRGRACEGVLLVSSEPTKGISLQKSAPTITLVS